MSGLPLPVDPFYTIIMCQGAHGHKCNLHMQRENDNSWFFWTIVHGKRYDFAPFGKEVRYADGTSYFEIQGVIGRTAKYDPFLEVQMQNGKANQWGIFQLQNATVTPEPSSLLLFATGASLLARKIYGRRKRSVDTAA